MSHPTKNFSYFFISRIIVTGINGVFWFLLATIIEPETYGEIGYLIALASVVSVFVRFGASQSIIVFQAKKEVKESNALNLLVLITSSIGAITLIPISFELAIFCSAIALFPLNQSNLLGLEKYRKFFFYGILKSGLTLTLPFVFYYFMGNSGIIIGLALANLLCCWNYFKNLKFIFSELNRIKENFRILLHNFGADLSNVLPKQVDKILIVPLYGLFITGIYQFNLQILLALEAIPLALQLYLLSEESRGNEQRKIIKFFIPLMVAIVVIGILIAPIIVSTIFPKFVEGIIALQILLVTLIPSSISSIYLAKLMAKKSTTVGYSTIIRVGSLLILIFLLGNQYGLEGLSIAFLISTVFNLIFLYFSNKSLNTKFKKHN